MIIAPIFTGPFRNLKHRGTAYAQKSPNFCIFIRHHHLVNRMIFIVNLFFLCRNWWFFIHQHKARRDLGFLCVG
nr:MAG TPA: hypothetical protein [Caudoviricetes sp.]